MNARKTLESKLRLLEIDLSNQSTEQYRLLKAVQELTRSVEFTREQIAMIRGQLARCDE